VALAAVALMAIELGARRYAPARAFWDEVRQSPRAVDVLFVGTSRTASAVDAEAFAAPGHGAGLAVINAGTGFATPAEFFLALRNTLAEQPDVLRGATVAIEAPGAMPEPQRWADSWAHPDRPDMLTPLLRVRDVPAYWHTSHALEDKLAITASYLLRPLAIVTHRQAIGPRLFGRVHGLLVSGLEFVAQPAEPVAAPADLTTAGGIRTDSGGVLLARRLAHDYAVVSMQNQQPIDWERTVVSDIMQLARGAGLRVVFFTPPLHSLHQAIYDTPQRRRDRDAFAAFAARQKTPILVPDFATTDADFPDIWHLKKSRSAEYTRALRLRYDAGL
jgi:hypothetical protein